MIIKRCAALILLLPVLFLAQCATGIKQTEMGPADAKKIMIAALSSEYKDRIVRDLADKYKVSSRVTVMPIEKLNSIDYKKYDVLVVIDALLAWQMFNATTRSFVGKVKEPEEVKKIVLFFTAGKPKEPYKVMGVDCITGASTVNTEAEVVRKISDKIDLILK